MNQLPHIFKKEIRPQTNVYRLGKKLIRETEFAMYLDDVLQGFARSYLDAEITLNAIVYELLTRGSVPTLAEVAADRAEVEALRLAA